MSRDAQLIKESWAAVEPRQERISQFFYAHAFLTRPDLRDMFPVVMDVQRVRLLQALVRVVQGFEDPDALAPYLRQLGRDHRKFAVTPDQYDVIGASLIAALKEYGGDVFTQEVEQAWITAYGVAAGMMIEAAETAAMDEPPWWNATVVSHEVRGEETAVITVETDNPMHHLPGQYVSAECPHRPRLWRPLSIANAPRGDLTLDFHVRAVPGGWVSRALVHHTRVGDVLRLGQPMGTMTPNPSSARNVLLVCGGTGFAPMKALVQDMVKWNTTRSVHLFAGSRTRDGLYDLADLEKTAADHGWLSVVSACSEDPTYLGELGNVCDVVARYGSWDAHDVYVSGSPQMVRATLAVLHRIGVPLSRISYDAFGDGR